MKLLKNLRLQTIPLCFLFLVSCVGFDSNTPKEITSLPEFYISPKQNNASNLHGVGDGYDLNGATKSALNNLASKLITNISSKSNMIMKSNNQNISEEFKQRISEKVEKVTFNNYQISNSAKFDNKIYVEISVDRANFIEQNSIKLNNINSRFRRLSNNLEEKNIIDQYRNLTKIDQRLPEAKSLNRIIDSLSGPVNLRKNFKLYSSYQSKMDKLLTKLIFKIDSKSDKKVARIIRKKITDKKLKITNRSSNSKNLVIIKISKNILSDKIYGSYVAKLKINISLINQNKTLANNILEVSGSSVISVDEAENSAITKFYKQIEEEGIEKILNL